MVEGYFKVSDYAKLSGISVDTAWHRVYRNSVDSIIGKDGNRYVYFSEYEPDDRYISLKRYGKENHVSYNTLLRYIRLGILKHPDIKKKRIPGMPGDFWSIHRDCVIQKHIRRNHGIPDGYMTIKAWAAKNDVNYNTVRAYAVKGHINSILIGNRRYILKGEPKPVMRKYEKHTRSISDT